MNFKYNPFFMPLNATITKPEELKRTYFQLYVLRYMNMAAARFQWKGLPKEIYPFAIEKFLLTSQIMFFQDEITGLYAVLPCGGAGQFDLYGFSNNRYSTASRYVEFKSKKDSVLLQDFIIDAPIMYYIYVYSETLAEMKVAKMTNINAQKTPVIISGPSDMELTVNNITNQINKNVPLLKIKDNILDEKIKINTLNISAPYVADKIELQMLREEGELLDILGIDNHVDSKNERLVSNEVLGGKGKVENFRKNALMIRENFAEKVNEMFGLNISVEFNTEIPILFEKDVSTQQNSDAVEVENN